MSNNPKQILFRADSSAKIGTGHIMRDLVLATQYPKATITFATQNLDGNINHTIIEAGYNIEILKSNDIKEIDKLINKLNINMLVIDHYGIDEKQEKKLSTLNSQLIIMILDDTYEKHYCNILLNHNIGANKKRYKDLVPKDCELRCGSKYTLLRDEFIKEKKKLKKKKQFKIQNSKLNIFIVMGGSDPQGYNFKVIDLISTIENIDCVIATTSANQKIKELKYSIEDLSNFKLYINSTNIAEIMSKSDIALVTPSVAINEIIFMQLPFIAIKVIENQDDMYQFLKKKGFLTLDSSKISELPKYIEFLKFEDNYKVQLEKISKVLEFNDE